MQQVCFYSISFHKDDIYRIKFCVPKYLLLMKPWLWTLKLQCCKFCTSSFGWAICVVLIILHRSCFPRDFISAWSHKRYWVLIVLCLTCMFGKIRLWLTRGSHSWNSKRRQQRHCLTCLNVHTGDRSAPNLRMKRITLIFARGFSEKK